jgi:hypothetical protein
VQTNAEDQSAQRTHRLLPWHFAILIARMGSAIRHVCRKRNTF